MRSCHGQPCLQPRPDLAPTLAATLGRSGRPRCASWQPVTLSSLACPHRSSRTAPCLRRPWPGLPHLLRFGILPLGELADGAGTRWHPRSLPAPDPIPSLRHDTSFIPKKQPCKAGVHSSSAVAPLVPAHMVPSSLHRTPGCAMRHLWEQARAKLDLQACRWPHTQTDKLVAPGRSSVCLAGPPFRL